MLGARSRRGHHAAWSTRSEGTSKILRIDLMNNQVLSDSTFNDELNGLEDCVP
ncbi:hypothetical protein HK413_12675 [Mucilaginibacter sp. S1162]|uniref:Uncharacterized protein n=1 Tax=Mucilaginibacter humi TaxID=2732510 RepID=A0ABX1W4V1_9SPHI|nr:hypothetical protein [Mucilaginibacter humi]